MTIKCFKIKSDSMIIPLVFFEDIIFIFVEKVAPITIFMLCPHCLKGQGNCNIAIWSFQLGKKGTEVSAWRFLVSKRDVLLIAIMIISFYTNYLNTRLFAECGCAWCAWSAWCTWCAWFALLFLLFFKTAVWKLFSWFK